MRNLIVLGVLFFAVGVRAQEMPTPEKTQKAVERLQDFAAKNFSAQGGSFEAGKSAGGIAFDGQAEATATQLPVHAPEKKAMPEKADAGIEYPDTGTGAEEDGQPGSPSDQISKMIADALQKKEVKDSIDKIRTDQMEKIFTKEVKIGIGIAGAGLVTAGVGLLIGSSAVTGVGLAVVGAVLLAGALSALFGKK